jgi:outer membrane lipoprotein SlyB
MNTTEATSPAMIKRGVVLDKRTVTVEELKNQGFVNGSTIVGGVAGYSYGNNLSGVLIGSTVGYLLAQAAPINSQAAIAYTVETDSSKIIRIVQAEENKEIGIGSHVFIEYSVGMRVSIIVDKSQKRTYRKPKETQYIN